MTTAVNSSIHYSPGTVLGHLHGKNSVLEAVQSAGFLTLPEVAPYANEITATLNALSPGHNQTILEALVNALGAGQTATVEWLELAAGVNDISVDVAAVPGGITITLHTRDGRVYTGEMPA